MTTGNWLPMFQMGERNPDPRHLVLAVTVNVQPFRGECHLHGGVRISFVVVLSQPVPKQQSVTPHRSGDGPEVDVDGTTGIGVDRDGFGMVHTRAVLAVPIALNMQETGLLSARRGGVYGREVGHRDLDVHQIFGGHPVRKSNRCGRSAPRGHPPRDEGGQ